MDKLLPEKISRPIGKWTCYKLECFADYIEAFAQRVNNTNYCYLELYAGCGQCTCKGTDCTIDDSPLRTLNARTKFARYIFVVRDSQDAESLKQMTAPYNAANIKIITGNPVNDKVLQQLHCQPCSYRPTGIQEAALVNNQKTSHPWSRLEGA